LFAFDSFSAFLAMGGYGGYVWGAYGVTAAVIVWLIIASRRMLSRARAAEAALKAER
jgi:heme exporter protein D